MKWVRIISITTSLILATSCSNTKIISSWKAENIPTGNYHKIMVLGLVREVDRNTGQQMEQQLVENLKQLGYDAVSAYQEYGPKAFEGMDENTAISKIKNTGIDAVMTTVLLNKTRERYYTPGHMYYSPYYIYYNRFWGYYTTLYDRIYSPDYYTTSTKYFWETNFYQLTTSKLLYSIQTQTFDSYSSEKLAKEYSKIIMNDMVKNNVLQKH